MLACKSCRLELAERFSQQSISEMEAALLTRFPPIPAHRHAMKKGPLCDPCLAAWQRRFRGEPPVGAKPAVSAVAPETRSPAMQQLHDACAALGAPSGKFHG